ncbi:putative membrane protein YqiK [Haloferula luteola]|uniref:Putative membrane protein YqiK n=1 Tax=Haloferula luteola TaxID=595692 RepID=A0A840V5R6_9BACT|nr:flotillin family protein [Haloferula luteola]MBB5350128.1 putative membrane protein YqiK [Haloferula luteola]
MKLNSTFFALIELPPWLGIVALCLAIAIGLVVMVSGVYAMLYRKVKKGTALIRTGFGGTMVNFNGMLVFPVFHRLETMDISLKRIEIDRTGRNGLICKDNMRADIKVAFFVRVNHADEDVLRVAQSVGCERASSQDAIRELFDAKFSEALKTVGKRFEFTQLYEDRDTFRDEILKVIGTDLNGFVLDDAAIDFLEQTPIESLDPDNILDAEGIKKITELTATQAKLANHIQRDKEKVIKQQDVEAREAILELERQLAETEAKQQREVDSVRAREEAETAKVREEERQKSERARIAAEEEIQVAEENKQRQVLVAQRNKERTDAVEVERVKRDQQLESIERERLTTLKDIDKEKAVEVERKAIQDVIKERVAVEKLVVIEQERIKDTEAFAGADREKQVKVTLAEAVAQEEVIRRVKEAEAVKQAAELAADQRVYEEVKAAEAARKAAELKAEERIVIAEAEQAASEKEAVAKKLLAEATTKESAAVGIGEAEVMLAKADATQKQGSAEAEVQRLKLEAEADGIHKKAEAMKLFEEAGQAHEEFKLNLEKDKAIELAQIHIQKDIAEAQAMVLGEAMKSAKIEIIGGENKFFDQISSAIARGKAVDRLVENSETLRDVKETFFNGDPDYFRSQLREWAGQFGVTAEDVKDLTVGAVLGKLLVDASGETRRKLLRFLGAADRFDLAETQASDLLK